MNFITLVEAITGSVVHTDAPRPTLGTQGPGLELTIHRMSKPYRFVLPQVPIVIKDTILLLYIDMLDNLYM